ncbi:transport protein YhjV [Escherichia coli]|nr:transport protein YhjV [Escherichia coli]
MNIAYRKREADKVLATRLALRTHRISYITLIAVILFFAFSFTFSISHEEAVSAFEQNISALALAAQVIPGHIIHITSTVAEYLCRTDRILWHLSRFPRGY